MEVHDGQSAGPMEKPPIPRDLPYGWAQGVLFEIKEPEPKGYVENGWTDKSWENLNGKS